MQVFNSLDGRQLVPYQAALLRSNWSQVRLAFIEAFFLQKTAYRRANGGTTAPNVHEDVRPRFLPSLRPVEAEVAAEKPQHKVVVRRTFLEVETEDEDLDLVCYERHGRRHRTETSPCTDPFSP